MTLSAIERNVALLKDHPALLGYYICDDCGPGVKMAPGYNTIRQLDPFHLTVGAGVRPIKAIRLFCLLIVMVADTGWGILLYCSLHGTKWSIPTRRLVPTGNTSWTQFQCFPPSHAQQLKARIRPNLATHRIEMRVIAQRIQQDCQDLATMAVASIVETWPRSSL